MEGLSNSMKPGSVGSILLPMLMSGVSLVAPKAGKAITAGLGVSDWLRGRSKVAEEEKAHTTLADIFSKQGADPAQQTPGVQAQAGGDTMGIPPSVLSNPAVAKIMLPLLIEQQRKKSTPREHWGTVGDQPTVYQSPGIGQPYTATPVGPKAPPEFPSSQNTLAMQLFGKPANQLTQEEWQKAHEYEKREQIDKEQRSVQNYFTKQDWMNQQSEKRQMGLIDETQLRQDTAAARRDYTKLNDTFRLNRNALNQARSAKARELGMDIAVGKRKQEIEADLDSWVKQIDAELMDDYLAQYEDWKTTYGHVSDRLKGFGMGGTPKVIEMRKKKLSSSSVELPSELKQFDPVKYKGRTVSNAAGKRWRSNGTTWVPE